VTVPALIVDPRRHPAAAGLRSRGPCQQLANEAAADHRA